MAFWIADTKFQKQILVAYLKQALDFNPESSIKSVTGFKHRNGGFAYRIRMTDGCYVIQAIPMTAIATADYLMRIKRISCKVSPFTVLRWRPLRILSQG